MTSVLSMIIDFVRRHDLIDLLHIEDSETECWVRNTFEDIEKHIKRQQHDVSNKAGSFPLIHANYDNLITNKWKILKGGEATSISHFYY